MKKMVVGALILLLIGIIGTISSFYFSDINLFDPVKWDQKKTVHAKGIDEIHIDSSSIDTIIERTNSQDIQVELAGKESKKRKGEYDLVIDQDSNALQIKLKHNIKWGITFYSNVKLHVKIPEKMYKSLNVKTSSGDLTIKDFQAENTSLQANSGDIIVQTGNVKEDLLVETSSGEIKADNTLAHNLSLKANSGDIIIKDGKVKKSLSVHVTSGDIHATNNQADLVTIKSTSGDLLINQLSANKSRFSSTSGEINVDDISGSIIASASSGDVEMAPNKQVGNLDLETTSGQVVVKTRQPSIPFSIDFKGGSGEGNISASGATYTEKSEHLIVGKIGLGDIQLKVRTSSGDFQLK